MAEATFRIDGIDEVQRAFGRLPDEVVKRVKRGLIRQAADAVVRSAQSQSPVRTGEFRKSHGARVRVYGDRVIAIVGIRRDKIQRDPINIDYLLEHGWRIVVGGTLNEKRARKTGKQMGKQVGTHQGYQVMERALNQAEAEVKQILTTGALEAVEQAVQAVKVGMG